MTVPLRVHAATHVGLVHPINEDSWAVTPTEEGGLLLLVCDGMGGMGRGDEASALSVESITRQLEQGTGLPPDRLRQAIRLADREVRDRLCTEDERNPGSTAVMAYVIDGAAHVAWVGDSRAYLVRDHRVVDRTRDHKLVEELVKAGRLTPEEAKASDFAHVVTRALGARSADDPDVKPETLGHPWKLAHGDTIVICSDGLCDLVEDDELPALVSDVAPDRATERLVEIALERGGHDNITVIVACWEGSTYQEDDVSTPVIWAERQHLPDLRVPDADLDRGDDSRVTEEIERDELEQMIGATPSGSPRVTPPPAPAADWVPSDDDGGGYEPVPREETTDELEPTPPTAPSRPEAVSSVSPEPSPAPARPEEAAATPPPPASGPEPGGIPPWAYGLVAVLVVLAIAAGAWLAS